MNAKRAGGGERGFTLIELMVVVSILSIVVLAIGQVMLASTAAIQVASLESDLEARATIVVDRIANEVKESGLTVTQLLPAGADPKTSIQFQPCTGYAGVAPTYGPVVTFSVTALGGKNVVQRIEGGFPQELTDLADINGLQFTLVGSALDISLALRRDLVVAGTGRTTTYSATRTTRVKIRNP